VYWSEVVTADVKLNTISKDIININQLRISSSINLQTIGRIANAYILVLSRPNINIKKIKPVKTHIGKR
jgi:hypothetical protein